MIRSAMHFSLLQSQAETNRESAQRETFKCCKIKMALIASVMCWKTTQPYNGVILKYNQTTSLVILIWQTKDVRISSYTRAKWVPDNSWTLKLSCKLHFYTINVFQYSAFLDTAGKFVIFRVSEYYFLWSVDWFCIRVDAEQNPWRGESRLCEVEDGGREGP